MRSHTLTALPVAVAVLVAIAACSSSSPTTTSGSGPASAPGQAAGASAPAAGGGSANGYEGSLVTSGGYDATWTVNPDVPAEPFNGTSGHTLSSDKETFGNVTVKPDGSVSFGSGAPELGQFTGTGAAVTLDATGGFVCAFTVDTDVASSDGKTLHLAGGMTVHWHPEGIGDLTCP